MRLEIDECPITEPRFRIKLAEPFSLVGRDPPAGHELAGERVPLLLGRLRRVERHRAAVLRQALAVRAGAKFVYGFAILACERGDPAVNLLGPLSMVQPVSDGVRLL